MEQPSKTLEKSSFLHSNKVCCELKV